MNLSATINAAPEQRRLLRLSAPGIPADAVLNLAVNTLRPQAQATGVAEADAWISSLGPDGYRSHPTEFEIERATSLL